MKNLVLLVLLGISGYATYGQQVVASAGQSATITGYQIDWTLGEPVIATLTGTNHILTQGMHQSRLKVTPIQEIAEGLQHITVYPNPVDLILNIGISNPGTTKFMYRLTDSSGKKLIQRKIHTDTEQVDMRRFTSGIYILQVMTQQNQGVQTYKIIKD